MLSALIQALTARDGGRRERMRFWVPQGRSLLIGVVVLFEVLVRFVQPLAFSLNPLPPPRVTIVVAPIER